MLFWLPTGAVVLVWLCGLAVALAQPPYPRKRVSVLALAAIGIAAVGVSGWEQGNRFQTGTRLDEVWTRLGDIKGLPALPAGASPEQTVDAVASAIEGLMTRISALQNQLASNQAKSQARSITSENAAKLVDVLRQAGSHRVVVSCVPEDVEAFGYANKIATLLRQAGWDALGPETTTIFGEGSGMGISLYVRSGTAPPEAAKLLVDGFMKANIAYQSGIMPSDAIPDTATVELFVGHKT